ncbi:hypothetical protein ACS0TY_025813 [Phlomoides rotata]
MTQRPFNSAYRSRNWGIFSFVTQEEVDVEHHRALFHRAQVTALCTKRRIISPELIRTSADGSPKSKPLLHCVGADPQGEEMSYSCTRENVWAIVTATQFNSCPCSSSITSRLVHSR